MNNKGIYVYDRSKSSAKEIEKDIGALNYVGECTLTLLGINVVYVGIILRSQFTQVYVPPIMTVFFPLRQWLLLIVLLCMFFCMSIIVFFRDGKIKHVSGLQKIIGLTPWQVCAT